MSQHNIISANVVSMNICRTGQRGQSEMKSFLVIKTTTGQLSIKQFFIVVFEFGVKICGNWGTVEVPPRYVQNNTFCKKLQELSQGIRT